jgi:hypothetical protein
MPFGWLQSIMLIPTYFINSYGNIIFDIHLYDLYPPNQRLGVLIYYNNLGLGSHDGEKVFWDITKVANGVTALRLNGSKW